MTSNREDKGATMTEILATLTGEDVAAGKVGTAYAEIQALRARLSEREAELLEACGPCEFSSCSLHNNHRGPCRLDPADR